MIEVKGLRIGIYTVTEISNRASKDYIIPDAATVEIKADETATVQFFNEKPEKPATPDNPDKAALLYGPLVLAVERGTEGMQAPAPFSNPALYNDYYTYNFHVPAHLRTSLKLDKKHPERALQRVGRDLMFTTEQGDVIRPLYDLHHQRYVVYWDLQSE